MAASSPKSSSDRPPSAESYLDRFGLTSFRPGQDEVVATIAEGQDVLCVMPTGGGKSLCYQLPSLMRSGVTLVVSPLIALMKDQVDTLRSLGIRAEVLNSTLDNAAQFDVMDRMRRGEVELVYIAPERLRNGAFLETLRDSEVTLLAVDEAHCISEWGHDFRPDYARLGFFRRRYLPGVQTVALTATATPTVRDDIVQLLELDRPKVFVTGFARTNLRFAVSDLKNEGQRRQALVDRIRSSDGAGIIYGATRKRCEEVAEFLSEEIASPVAVYHAGLEPETRRQVQEAFMAGELPIIVATNAFGMGIDKSDIRFVIHYNMPGTLEAYYQEAGRAGRDGQMSDCHLLFSYQDRYVQEFFIENRYPSKETVQKVHAFLIARTEDPIELTLDEVRDAIKTDDSSEAIGTAETLLAKARVLRRLDAATNQMMVRIESDAPTLLDFLPREAKMRRRVLSAVEGFVGDRRGEDIFIRPDRLMRKADVDRPTLTRTLRELRKLRSFDYVPPFRGRAVHVVDGETPFEKLAIDFDELARRKAAEYEKLESVIAFARSPGCRQSTILNYFGETDAEPCGRCDRCDAGGGVILSGVRPASSMPDDAPEKAGDAMLVRGLQIVLSGVTRTHGRFGRNLIAQMLGGSTNKKLQGLRLHRLSTYGLLDGMRQSEIVDVIDVLTSAGYCRTVEVEQRRPTVEITAAGTELMMGRAAPSGITLSFPLAKKLSRIAASIDPPGSENRVADNEVDPHIGSPSSGGPASSGPPGEVDERVGSPASAAGQAGESAERIAAIEQRLRRWRHRTATAHGIPAFRVLTNAVLRRVAEAQPETTEGLLAVTGIGAATVEQFGYELTIAIAEAVAAEREESDRDASVTDPSHDPASAPAGDPSPPPVRETNAAEPSTGRQPPTATDSRREPATVPREASNDAAAGPSGSADAPRNATDPSNPTLRPDDADGVPRDAYWTWRLFHDGYNASEVAEIRGRQPAKVVLDLKCCQQHGLAVRPHWLADFP